MHIDESVVNANRTISGYTSTVVIEQMSRG